MDFDEIMFGKYNEVQKISQTARLGTTELTAITAELIHLSI